VLPERFLPRPFRPLDFMPLFAIFFIFLENILFSKNNAKKFLKKFIFLFRNLKLFCS